MLASLYVYFMSDLLYKTLNENQYGIHSICQKCQNTMVNIETKFTCLYCMQGVPVFFVSFEPV